MMLQSACIKILFFVATGAGIIYYAWIIFPGHFIRILSYGFGQHC